MGARYFYGWNVVAAVFVMAPAVRRLIEMAGFTHALRIAGLASIVVVGGVAVTIMRRGPATLGLAADGDRHRSTPAAVVSPAARHWRREALGTWRFWSVSAPFALGLAAQVGVLTHLVAVVIPTLGAAGAVRALSATTAAAILGRLLTGVVVDR